MKSPLPLSLILGTAVTLGWLFMNALESGPAHADGEPGQGGGVSANGDVNGDLARDLSDAVYILAHLFQGGPAPLSCSGDGAGGDTGGGGGLEGDGLPDTGQKKCYNDQNPPNLDIVEVDCATAACPGQDAFYENGCGHGIRFVVNEAGTPEDISDDTVLDACTGLTWQRDTPDFNGEEGLQHSTCRDVNGDFTRCFFGDSEGVGMEPGDLGDDIPWCDALAYCESLSLGGQDDWRLPNVRELMSIADYGLGVNSGHAAMDEEAFVVVAALGANNSRFYWTSTFHERALGTYGPRAWTVNYSHGHVGAEDVDRSHFVRAVRGGAAGGGAAVAGGGAVQGQGAGVSGNGDVNGDLSLDLSDAIFLLAFLFQGGPEPEDCGSPEVCDNGADDDFDGATDCADDDCTGTPACTESICDDNVDNDSDGDTDCADSDCSFTEGCLPTPSLLPATGKEICFDEAGATTDCTTGDCPGQDASYAANGIGCPDDASRFVVNDGGALDTPGMPVDDTITDTCTGLTWQRDQSDVFADGQISFDAGTSDEANWCDALLHCEGLDFGGHNDWRLPNVRELQSIVDYSLWSPDLPMDPKFKGIASWYWSSTSNTEAPALKYFVNFDIGEVRHTAENKIRSVRAVRGP
jgi:hypothetical protein